MLFTVPTSYNRQPSRRSQLRVSLPAVFVPDMRDYDDLGGVLGNPMIDQIRLPGSNYKATANQYPITYPPMAISPTGLNLQKILLLPGKNCKCIPFCRTFLGFPHLMGLFWDLAR